MPILSWYGKPICDTAGMLYNGGLSVASLDGVTNFKIATFFQLGDTVTHGPLTGCYVNCTSITSPPVFQLSLQGITTRGTPDGTIKGGASPVSTTFTPTVSHSIISFANSYTGTVGEIVCAVLELSSGTFDATHKATFCRAMAGTSNTNLTPYAATNTGSWPGTISQLPPGIVPVYQDGYVGRGYFAATTSTSSVAASTSYGTLWTPPCATPLTLVKVGVRPAAGSFVQVTVYEGSSTTIASTTPVSQSLNQSLRQDLRRGCSGDAVSRCHAVLLAQGRNDLSIHGVELWDGVHAVSRHHVSVRGGNAVVLR
jgi:hypothetical protein